MFQGKTCKFYNQVLSEPVLKFDLDPFPKMAHQSLIVFKSTGDNFYDRFSSQKYSHKQCKTTKGDCAHPLFHFAGCAVNMTRRFEEYKSNFHSKY